MSFFRCEVIKTVGECNWFAGKKDFKSGYIGCFQATYEGGKRTVQSYIAYEEKAVFPMGNFELDAKRDTLH